MDKVLCWEPEDKDSLPKSSTDLQPDLQCVISTLWASPSPALCSSDLFRAENSIDLGLCLYGT